ncbi:ABC transporter ATP-binding protein [Salinarimonas ramus]|uniref:ABC transporter ATP-binding protein n=1 Tax=Salinarimonas ramus TaxID=690164 RepID=A0A917QB54_9HYPH|nr:ABC transporter ATP-binding protein [Salinarimonas ramus]GGK41774.1 ABC transporter ATP-binding protein [Salinarimonas ramus]
MSEAPILSVEDLAVTFSGPDGRRTRAVDGVSFSVSPGRTLGIVGESGCGKSVTSLSVMGLLPKVGTAISGRILFEGRDLLRESERSLRDLRGDRLAMIFQEPMTSLNPSYTIGDQIVEAIVRHRAIGRREAAQRAVEMLERVRIPEPAARFHDYPHKLSGGMRQRVMIAMALACEPRLLIADEPTTALDVTIQAQILELMRALREETGTAIVLITHDLGVVAEVCDEVAVMYAGQVVERAPVEELFRFPQHPYTVGLMGSLPRFDRPRTRLAAIEGAVPDMSRPPEGCRFAARCPFRIPRCETMPELAPVGPDRSARCWRAPLEELAA